MTKPATSSLHNCAAQDCDEQVPGRFLMCRDHWYKVPLAIKNEVNAAYSANPNMSTPEKELATMRAANSVAFKEGLMEMPVIRKAEEKLRKMLFPHDVKAKRHGFSKVQYQILCRLNDLYIDRKYTSYMDLSSYLGEWTKTLQHASQYLIKRNYIERADNDVTNERVRLTEDGHRLVFGLKKQEANGTLVLGM